MAEVWYKNSKQEIFCLKHAIKEIKENNSDIDSFVDNLDYFYNCKKCAEENKER